MLQLTCAKDEQMTQELHHSLMGSSTNFILVLVVFSVLT